MKNLAGIKCYSFSRDCYAEERAYYTPKNIKYTETTYSKALYDIFKKNSSTYIDIVQDIDTFCQYPVCISFML